MELENSDLHPSLFSSVSSGNWSISVKIHPGYLYFWRSWAKAIESTANSILWAKSKWTGCGAMFLLAECHFSNRLERFTERRWDEATTVWKMTSLWELWTLNTFNLRFLSLCTGFSFSNKTSIFHHTRPHIQQAHCYSPCRDFCTCQRISSE